MPPQKKLLNHLLSNLRKFGVALGAVAVSCGATYLLCQESYEDEIAELQNQIAELQKKEQEARVTQRISEQMEDIAFQQKSLSDKQREEAIKQSRIADMERGKAEYERGMAQQAQRQALLAAEQADKMRLIAENQSDLATKNMIAAQQARAKADTLFYLSMSNSLAQSALAMGNTATDISRLLSYASWQFTEQYGGDVNSSNIYKSMLMSSSSMEHVSNMLRGSVRIVEVIKIDNLHWTLCITDYGEICLFNDALEHRLFTIDSAPFRSIARLKGNVCAVITSDGRLITMEFTDGKKPQMKLLKETHLTNGLWKAISCTDDKSTLVAMNDNSLVWLDSKSLAIKKVTPLSQGLSTMGYDRKHKQFHIFGAKNTHYIATSPDDCQRADLTKVKGLVTAYYCDQQSGNHLLGMESGKIYIIAEDGRMLNTLTGHSSAISSVRIYDGTAASTSYDHTMRFWIFNATYTRAESMEFTYSTWPMSFALDRGSEMIWIGNEGGEISRFCTSTTKNAIATQNLLRREFTQEEWEYYIGKSVPYRTFMKGGSK